MKTATTVKYLQLYCLIYHAEARASARWNQELPSGGELNRKARRSIVIRRPAATFVRDKAGAGLLGNK